MKGVATIARGDEHLLLKLFVYYCRSCSRKISVQLKGYMAGPAMFFFVHVTFSYEHA